MKRGTIDRNIVQHAFIKKQEYLDRKIDITI